MHQQNCTGCETCTVPRLSIPRYLLVGTFRGPEDGSFPGTESSSTSVAGRELASSSRWAEHCRIRDGALGWVDLVKVTWVTLVTLLRATSPAAWSLWDRLDGASSSWMGAKCGPHSLDHAWTRAGCDERSTFAIPSAVFGGRP